MSVRSSEILDIRQELPPRLRAKAESVLKADEALLAWFEPDLDARLHFSSGLLLLTDTRLISLSECDQGHDNVSGGGGYSATESWYLSAELALQAREKGGASSLELVDCRGLVTQWRHTLAKAKAAHYFVDRWKLLRNGPSAEGEAAEPAEALCPSCGAPIKGEQGLCENCTALREASPSARSCGCCALPASEAGWCRWAFS